MVLASPVFFPRSHWITGPRDWSREIVSGKGYDTRTAEGRRIWEECLERLEVLHVSRGVSESLFVMEERARYGSEILVRPRLGQGTFRFAVQNAYGRCAITGERSLPALEAAHIRPYAFGGRHEIPNGLLLRADIHKLYDRGYVTVTPDFKFRVSPRLDKDYHNGRIYYELEQRRIWTPGEALDMPDRDALAFHAEEVFLR